MRHYIRPRRIYLNVTHTRQQILLTINQRVIEHHYAVMKMMAEELARKNNALQAQIDALILEYCPDEMTTEQITNWEKHQKTVLTQNVQGQGRCAALSRSVPCTAGLALRPLAAVMADIPDMN